MKSFDIFWFSLIIHALGLEFFVYVDQYSWKKFCMFNGASWCREDDFM